MSDLLSTITRERRRNMLRTAMGPAIAQALDEPDVVELVAYRLAVQGKDVLNDLGDLRI